ncbi:cysteate synthase [Amycolatopsis sp. lyj-346]|uniref:cysteate synthase n=1 Tax=Amycolatopsis sp. lyj-346 TaxID=2789289 RepID=UPI00397A50DB
MTRPAYRLVCPLCEEWYEDDGLLLACSEPHADALLKTAYPARRETAGAGGLFRYRDWLPVRRVLPDAGAPAVLPAGELGRRLGLAGLWISFSGYWPEAGAGLATGTFKELEAHTVLGRLPDEPPVLVVASAGNTAAAFAAACSRYRVRCVLVVPAAALPRLRFAGPLDDCVRLIALDGGRYRDAIALAGALGSLPGYQAEGGVRNVARRDGLGTVLLAAYEAMGGMPGWYFQAVGSGAGALGVHEAALRLAEHEDAGPPPKIVMCQNLPYAPIHQRWTGHPASGSDGDLIAPELANANPPYATAGGVADCLAATGGDVLAVGNDDAARAVRLFEEVFGIDIEPSAGVALAALQQAAEAGRVPAGARILLNITGGGRARFAREHVVTPANPAVRLVVPRNRAFPSTEDVLRAIAMTERGDERVVTG